jgi:hypothetical protein
MHFILGALSKAGAEGIVLPTGEGVYYRGHPILAAYVGDYPEQILVTCCITGDCPQCNIPRNLIGANTEPHPLRSLNLILDALALADKSLSDFIAASSKVRVKPIFDPFWAFLPYSNIYMSITPDLLHQLYQGVFKHLKGWVEIAVGKEEIDARCRRLPPNHNIRMFMKGISFLSRVTGQEHDQISRFFLGLVAEVTLPGGLSSTRLVRAVKAILDFLFITQRPIQSTSSLASLTKACQDFHDNKQIFVDLGIRDAFNIPKLHFLNHYVTSAKRFGTFDNFNTQHTERLHIDLAKDAYRASNRKDEYSQMTKWLERKEIIRGKR